MNNIPIDASVLKDKAIRPTTNFSLKRITSFHLDAGLVDEFENYTGQLFKGF